MPRAPLCSPADGALAKTLQPAAAGPDLADVRGHQALWDKIASTTVVDDPNNVFNL